MRQMLCIENRNWVSSDKNGKTMIIIIISWMTTGLYLVANFVWKFLCAMMRLPCADKMIFINYYYCYFVSLDKI